MLQRKYNLNFSLAVAVSAILVVIILGMLQKQFEILGPANMAAFGFVKSIRSLPLTFAMTGITWFGEGLALMMFISVVFWLGYTTEIVTFMLIVMFGSAISEHLKDFFAMHRPVTSEIPIIGKAKGYGYPSGHSQSGMYYSWLIFAFTQKYWPLCLIPAALIAFSRIYLGVHYLSDTIGGLLLGFGMIAGAMGIYGHLRDLQTLRESIRRSFALRLGLSFGLSACYLLLAWGQPDAFKYGGFLLGFFTIYSGLTFKWRARNPFFAIIASIIGLVVLLALQIGARISLPRSDISDYFAFLVQGIILAISPWVFLKIGLLKKLVEAPAEEVLVSTGKEEMKEPVDVK